MRHSWTSLLSVCSVLSFSQATEAHVSIGTGCLREVVCERQGACRTRISYGISKAVSTGGYDFFLDSGSEMKLDRQTGDVRVVTDDMTVSMGRLDFSQLNCRDQETDYRPLELQPSPGTVLEVRETWSMGQCNATEGRRKRQTRSVKFGLFINGSRLPSFSTLIETVSCPQ
jgi:hypothetical protein